MHIGWLPKCGNPAPNGASSRQALIVPRCHLATGHSVGAYFRTTVSSKPGPIPTILLWREEENVCDVNNYCPIGCPADEQSWVYDAEMRMRVVVVMSIICVRCLLWPKDGFKAGTSRFDNLTLTRWWYQCPKWRVTCLRSLTDRTTDD